MKPDDIEVADKDTENSAPVAGDAIGDTAYSERFVLKILLKLANLDTLKDEVLEKSFEDDLCTLWDMTAERDVVLFLLKHEVFNLLNFVLPVIDSPRVIEIIVGIVANMSCQKEAVTILLNMDSFLKCLLENVKTDDSLVLIQVLRLITSSLFVADDDAIAIWMELFEQIDYSTVLYFILKNSSNKNVLVTALENFNTVCSYCNIEKFRTNFFNHFVTLEALLSLATAFTEVTVNQKSSFDREELERILVITLQITLTLVGFDKSVEIYRNNKFRITKMISHILNYYENKLINKKEIDSDLADVIDCTNTIVKILKLSETSDPEAYVEQSYSMWKALKSISRSDQDGRNFEDGDKEEVQEVSKQMNSPLSTLICIYIEKCMESNLLKVLDKIGMDFENIVNSLRDDELKATVSKRVADNRNRSRLEDNVDS